MPAPNAPSEGRAFQAQFKRWSRRVRSRLALRHVLTGAALGLVLGAGASAAAWRARHAALRPSGAIGGLVGAAVGFAVARKRRWNDDDVALYLDAKLGTDEAIATAAELERKSDPDDPVRAVVVSQAVTALAQATPKQVRAPWLRPWHAAIPVAAAAIGWLSVIPLPPAPAAPPLPPGAERVQIADLKGLEKVIKLSELDARDEAQRERLKKLAEEAKRIREKLQKGAEKREALADIAKLRDAITAERLSLGDGEQRAGLESALGKLGENPDLKNAQKALGDRDLVQFDEEMQRLANKLEASDRERAKKTLEEAAEQAKKAGAPDVAKELEQQKKLLEERAKKNEKLRELAKELGESLGQEGQEALEDFNGSGSPKDQQRLADALEKALGKMSPEERKKLAENMKKRMQDAPEESMGGEMSKKQMRDLAEQLDSPEGQKRLEEELKRMAEEPPPGSDEADRQKSLGDAEEGAGEAEGQLGGGAPMPMPIAGQGQGQAGKGNDNGNDKGQGSPGHSEGGGPGDHKGQTGVVEGGELKAHAAARINKGKPMPGVVMGRSAGRPGDTANIVGQGALGSAAPGELGGIERSDVPEEYREQVGRYFQPK